VYAFLSICFLEYVFFSSFKYLQIYAFTYVYVCVCVCVGKSNGLPLITYRDCVCLGSCRYCVCVGVICLHIEIDTCECVYKYI